MIKTFNTLFVTMFGIGMLKPIPGTFGSLATVIILYFCFNLTSYSQIYATYDEVIEYYGKDYTVENSDYYDLLIKFDIKKDFGNQWNLFGFIILESGKKVCNYVHIMEPKSRTNYWINYLNEKGYVKIEDLEWRDYENGINFKIDIFETGVSYIKTPYLSD